MKTNKQTKNGETTTTKTNKKSMAPRAGRPKSAAKNYHSGKSIQISGNLSFHVFYLFYISSNKSKACFKNSIQATSQQNFKLL